MESKAKIFKEEERHLYKESDFEPHRVFKILKRDDVCIFTFTELEYLFLPKTRNVSSYLTFLVVLSERFCLEPQNALKETGTGST